MIKTLHVGLESGLHYYLMSIAVQGVLNKNNTHQPAHIEHGKWHLCLQAALQNISPGESVMM